MTAASGAADGTVDVETDASGPYEVVWLDNGTLRLGIVPALGGRLLSLVHDGEELLWRNPALLDGRLHPVGGHRPERTSGPMANWCNYGGDKTWPAPQGWSSPGSGPGRPTRCSTPALTGPRSGRAPGTRRWRWTASTIRGPGCGCAARSGCATARPATTCASRP
ncbi:hypothetical protein [Actinomadura madurae]|uniref:hypothetical protein n=1 Tax=Actinomadura madurae TaxID=1993 RepID=UPI0020D25A81|nr:hypothetical protein [Actinomadura madurae]MCQ0020724.1 hypothetical protein [Actinomadura madurae]